MHAALLLAAQGVPTLALERNVEVSPLPRAVALDDEALRLLQATGLDAHSRPALLTTPTVRFRSRRAEPLLELPPHPSPYGHPSLAFVRQPDLDAALRGHLRDQDLLEMRLGQEVQWLRPDAEGVPLEVRDVRSGRTQQVRARYVLACDGARSLVRRSLRIPLRGLTSARRWLVVDTLTPDCGTGNQGFAAADFEFGCDSRRPWVHGPLPEATHRWEFMLTPGEDPGELERPEAVRRLLASY